MIIYLKKHWLNLLALFLIVCSALAIAGLMWLSFGEPTNDYGCIQKSETVYYESDVSKIPESIVDYECSKYSDADECMEWGYRTCGEYGNYFSLYWFFYLLIEPLAYLLLAWIGFGIIYTFAKKKKNWKKTLIILVVSGAVIVLYLSGALDYVLGTGYYLWHSLTL